MRPATGRIYDADIEFNDEFFAFVTDNPTPGLSVDIRNTLTHEVGHFIGLDHSSLPDSTMYGAAAVGELHKRDLHPDDREGLCSIYVDDGTRPTFQRELPEPVEAAGSCVCAAPGGGDPRARPISLLVVAIGACCGWAARRGAAGRAP